MTGLLRSFFAIAIPITVVACASEDDTAERKCQRLRDHVIDLRMEGVPSADQAAHRTALKQALGDQFTEQCKTMTPKQVECGLRADEISAAAACTSH